MNDLLKTAEVAKLLRVHPKHVYRLLDQGLPGRRVGGEWRFVREEILAWSAHREEISPAQAKAASNEQTAAALLGANGDLVVEILLAQLLGDDKPLVGFIQSDRQTALSQLEKKAILLAGYHADRPPAHFEATRLARIHLVRRQVGLAHPTSLRVRSLGDIARRRLAMRPASAGVRAHFDRAMVTEHMTLRKLEARTTVHASHRDTVCAVVRGEADLALTTAAWAERVGLRFYPIAEESYDLLLFAEHLGDPRVVGVCEVAQSRSFRNALDRVAGYKTDETGEIRYEFETAQTRSYPA
ncbi:MAG: helix-turn-helix transcriptional regulator [Polyangiaceae bacterium]|nr:helix-turn-helix transcriptional regulator [Polyangiaceae bacterium]